MRTTWLALSLFALVACGSDSKSGGNDAAGGGGDAPQSQYMDAPPQVPATITIMGIASERSLNGATPKQGVMVAAYANSAPTTPVAMATTDATGAYTLTITTGGVALDGFIKATLSGYLDTYLFPPAPLTADFGAAALNMVTQTSYGLIYSLTTTTQDNTKATIALIVADNVSSMMPVAGAKVISNPTSTDHYNGTNGLPSSSTTTTQADPTGYLLNVPVGPVSVTATKTGLTFKSHTFTPVKGALNTTLVIE